MKIAVLLRQLILRYDRAPGHLTTFAAMSAFNIAVQTTVLP